MNLPEEIRPPQAICKGAIDIDLGEWLFNGQQLTAHLHINGEHIAHLIERVESRKSHQLILGYGALNVTVQAARKDGGECSRKHVAHRPAKEE